MIERRQNRIIHWGTLEIHSVYGSGRPKMLRKERHFVVRLRHHEFYFSLWVLYKH
jgi:hypothetical protein